MNHEFRSKPLLSSPPSTKPGSVVRHLKNKVLKDYYYILGLSKNASLQEIKSAFRKLSLKFHPDKNNGEDFFTNRFKEILEAYEILSNEKKRIFYDEKLKQFSNSNFNEKLRQREDELKKKYEEEIKREKEKIKRENPITKQSTETNPKSTTKNNTNLNNRFLALVVTSIIILILFIVNNTSKVNNSFDGGEIAIETYNSDKYSIDTKAFPSKPVEVKKEVAPKSQEEKWNDFYKEFLNAVEKEDINAIAELSYSEITISTGGMDEAELKPIRTLLNEDYFSNREEKDYFKKMANTKIEEYNFDGFIGKRTKYVEIYQLEFRYSNGRWLFYGIGISC